MHARSRGLVIAILMALVATACGNSDSDTGKTADPPDQPDPSGDPATPPDAAGGRDTFVEISGVPGVSDDEIAYSIIGTKANNPLGTCILDCFQQGIQAYFDFRNDEGGIYGRDLVIGNVLDDELANNQVRAIDVISAGDAFGVFSATLIASGWGDLDDAGVPTYVWNIHGTEFANRPSIIGHIGANCINCTQRGFPYLVELSGATKVATLGYGTSENSKVCAQSLRDSIAEFSDAIGGAEVVYFNDELGFGLPNGVGPEVTAMKQAGVEFVGSCMDLNGMKTIGQELQRQGMDDVVMAHPNTYDQDFVTEAGGIFEGDYITPGFLPFEADAGNELQDKFREFMGANDNELTEMAMVGFINAHQAFTSLIEAGPDFDQAKAIAGINALTAEDSGGLHPPIDWTRQHTPPTPDDPLSGSVKECFAPVQVIDGLFETVADPATPWFCWENSNEILSEPEQVAFASN